MVIVGHEVSGRENRQVVHIAQNLTCQAFNLTNAVNFIPEKLHTEGVFITRSWENLHHISTYTEASPLEVNVIALKLDIYQGIEQLVPGNLLAGSQTNHAL